LTKPIIALLPERPPHILVVSPPQGSTPV